MEITASHRASTIIGPNMFNIPGTACRLWSQKELGQALGCDKRCFLTTMPRSIRSAIEIGSGLWDEEESLFGTTDSAASIWEWLQGPVVDLVYADTNIRCSTNNSLEHLFHSLKELDHVAPSSTNREEENLQSRNYL